MLSPPGMMEPKNYLSDQRFIINFGLLFDCFVAHELFNRRPLRLAFLTSYPEKKERAREHRKPSLSRFDWAICTWVCEQLSDGSLIITRVCLCVGYKRLCSTSWQTVIRCFSSIISDNLQSDLSPPTTKLWHQPAASCVQIKWDKKRKTRKLHAISKERLVIRPRTHTKDLGCRFCSRCASKSSNYTWKYSLSSSSRCTFALVVHGSFSFKSPRRKFNSAFRRFNLRFHAIQWSKLFIRNS